MKLIVCRCTQVYYVQCLLCFAMVVCYQTNSFPWVIPSVKLFWFSHCVYHQSPIILPIFTECLSPFMECLSFSFTIANTVAHMYMCVHEVAPCTIGCMNSSWVTFEQSYESVIVAFPFRQPYTVAPLCSVVGQPLQITVQQWIYDTIVMLFYSVDSLPPPPPRSP